LSSSDSDSVPRSELPARTRPASSFARSQEQRDRERSVLEEGLRQLTSQWIRKGEFERLKCIELLFVLGWPNKTVAERLRISEQAVANHKFYAVNKLREWWEKSPHVQGDLESVIRT
jgi:RNA polymerase sigma-70 factor (ECF subfamily)